jgi:hypothetical protein
MTPSLTSAPPIELDEFDALDGRLIDEPTVPQASRSFLEVCNECERVCFETANHCLTEGGSLSDVRGIQLLRNCARVCRTSAAAWSVGSRLYSQVLRAASRLCGECATACEQLASDRQLKTCAQMCRECAESCDRMAQIPREIDGSLTRSA